MTKRRRHPTSPYLLRRLRSYEEVRADQAAARDDVVIDAEQDQPACDPDGKTEDKTG